MTRVPSAGPPRASQRLIFPTSRVNSPPRAGLRRPRAHHCHCPTPVTSRVKSKPPSLRKTQGDSLATKQRRIEPPRVSWTDVAPLRWSRWHAWTLRCSRRAMPSSIPSELSRRCRFVKDLEMLESVFESSTAPSSRPWNLNTWTRRPLRRYCTRRKRRISPLNSPTAQPPARQYQKRQGKSDHQSRLDCLEFPEPARRLPLHQLAKMVRQQAR